jgi:hypothetical protein
VNYIEGAVQNTVANKVIANSDVFHASVMLRVVCAGDGSLVVAEDRHCYWLGVSQFPSKSMESQELLASMLYTQLRRKKEQRHFVVLKTMIWIRQPSG